MSRKRRKPAADDPLFIEDMDAHIARLREMLVLMAPETGTSALGGTVPFYDTAPRRREALLLLPSPDAANL